MRLLKFIGLIALSGGILISPSCTEEQINDFTQGSDLSDSEIAQALRKALQVGTDTSVTQLNRPDGYLKDAAVKILLPATLQSNIEDFKNSSIDLGFTTISGTQIYNGTSVAGVTIPGLKSQEDELIKGINRAAEEAAGTAGPIFRDAVAGITIKEARSILFDGVDTAATAYLRQETYPALFSQYKPKMDSVLAQVQVGNTNVPAAYQNFVADYNDVVNTQIPGFGKLGGLLGVSAVGTTDISAYSTDKGMDGLFHKIGEEEKSIREDPLARINSLLSRVFGQLDN